MVLNVMCYFFETRCITYTKLLLSSLTINEAAEQNARKARQIKVLVLVSLRSSSLSVVYDHWAS